MRPRAIWLLLCAGAACATPVPQPPPENLDVGKIVIPEAQPATTGVDIYGSPGAAPPNSLIRVTNLETTDPPSIILVNDDGSFHAGLSAELEDELRFQVRIGDDRKPPIDLVFLGGGFAFGERIDCFRVALETGFGTIPAGVESSTTVVLDNQCAVDAEVDSMFLRTKDPTFGVTAEPPAIVAAGTSELVDVTFAPGGAGEVEEVLLIGVTIDGQAVRYPVTLFGAGE
jgi:hypothetical protein